MLFISQRVFLTLLLISSFKISEVIGQPVIFTGKVVDVITKEPLAGVNIFLSGTTYGDATNSEGTFIFEMPKKGRFNLVVSFIGYKNISIPLILNEPATVYQLFELEEDVLSLAEIEVHSRKNRSWEKAYNDFKEFFIGRDEYAYFTNILNPTVLEFSWDKTQNMHSVSASQPLLIKNDAIGYEVSVLLQEIEFNPRTNGGFYTILPRFSEMIPPDTLKNNVWKFNRNQIYSGSSRHFFKTLATGKLNKSEFTILPDSTSILPVQDLTRLKLYFPNDWEQISTNYVAFHVPERTFKVGYNLEYDRRGRVKNRNQISTISLKGISDLILVDQNGLLYNPAFIQFLGKWEADRFAKHLPIDFEFDE